MLKPLPPDPARHQDSALARRSAFLAVLLVTCGFTISYCRRQREVDEASAAGGLSASFLRRRRWSKR